MKNKHKTERRGGARPGAGRKPIGDARKIDIQLGLRRELLERIDQFAMLSQKSRAQTIANLCEIALTKR